MPDRPSIILRSASAPIGRVTGLGAAALLLTALLGATHPHEPRASPTVASIDDDDALVSADPPADRVRPRRVHLQVDRYEELGGEVIEEDHDLIVIRTRAGEIRSFPKGRLIRIIPLLDVDEPRPGIVEMRDGTIMTGELVADDYDEVILRIAGINTRFDRDAVLRSRFDLTIEEKYERFRESIDPEAWNRRFELALWLFEQKAYKLAHRELVEIVEKSQLPPAINLLRKVEAQLALDDDAAEDMDREDREWVEDDGGGRLELADLLPQTLLSEEDVNIIRVYEIDFRDPPLRVMVQPETIRELLERYGSDKRVPTDSVGRTRLFRAEPIEIVDLMFQLKARDLYSRIEVTSEPPALNLFRHRVHDAWLIPNCATSRCHGGLDGGRFFLHRRNHTAARVRYTNLLILERWNELDRPLVDFEDPGSSLIIQYALPREEARFAHPDVRGWRPVFTRGNRRALRESLAWISSMYRPRPGYPVDFEAPVLEPPQLPEPETGDSAAPFDGRRDR